MGDRLTEDTQSKQTSPYPYGDIFDEFFPHYLVMGMTPEQYWDGESSLKKAFRKAYQIRMENDQRFADYKNWSMGQYVISVLSTVPLLVGGLNVKSRSSLPDYPDKPLLEKAAIQKKEKAQKKQQEDQTKLAMAMFQAGIMKFNKRFEREQKAKAKSGQ